MRRGAARSAAWALVGTLGAMSFAHADAIDDLGKKLIAQEADVLQIERGLMAPQKSQQAGEDKAVEHFASAQAAYADKNYADASIALFDIVERFDYTRVYPEAVFLLADSLFQKRDYLSARDYFRRIVKDFGEHGQHYQESLERLVELSLRLDDPNGVDEVLQRLDKVPQARRLQSAPYVRGKYLYFSGAIDDAMRILGSVDQSSAYHFQAQYFIGTALVAKGSLEQAAKTFRDITTEKPRTATEARVVALAHLALGRIDYERDQLAEAIDQYLLIPRKSDLFDEALYEIAWVYVKSKQLDNALRALGLLAIANPDSAKLPDVRILEGNLRIRKAQSLADLQQQGNSFEEYAKAVEVFEKTRAAFEKPRDELASALAAQPDARKFLDQLTGKAIDAFDAQVAVPPLAVKWVKDEPEVTRVVAMSGDLSRVRKELDETNDLLARLERAVNSPSRVKIFPDLAERGVQVQEISEEALKIRQQLTVRERELIAKWASPRDKEDLDHQVQRQTEMTQRLATLPNGTDIYSERVRKARENVVALDRKAQEIEVVVVSLENELGATEKYYKENNGSQELPAAVYAQMLGELRDSIHELREELASIRRDALEAMDEAGVGDDVSQRERNTRRMLGKAVKAEHDIMRGILAKMNADDRMKAEQIESLLTRTTAVEEAVSRANLRIDSILDEQLADVRITLHNERDRLDEYRRALEAISADSVELGSSVVHQSFTKIASKFDEIAVRADLGIVDVAWAQKEEMKGQRDRASLESARERRILNEEFKDVGENAHAAP